MSVELGDGTNQHCRRLFARRRKFEFGENIFPWKNSLSGRRLIDKLQHRLPHQTLFVKRGVANLKTMSQPAKKISNLTPVEKGGATALKSGCTCILFFF